MKQQHKTTREHVVSQYKMRKETLTINSAIKQRLQFLVLHFTNLHVI